MKISCVMLVDDSESDQFICKSLLERHDAELTILQAYDGQEALEILESTENKPEIIFLDINMPRMNGHEFLAEYNKTEYDKSIVIAMLTSSQQKTDKENSAAYTCVKHYLVKPLGLPDLQTISMDLS